MINRSELYNEVCSQEGGKQNMNIAQVSECCHCLLVALAARKPSAVLALLEEVGYEERQKKGLPEHS